MPHAYNLLKYQRFWYADTLAALVASLEGAESEMEVTVGKERVYDNLKRGLREDLRKNGLKDEQVDGELTTKPGHLWAEWLGWIWTLLGFGSESESGYTKDFSFKTDKRTDAMVLNDAKEDIDHWAVFICSNLKHEVDSMTIYSRELNWEINRLKRIIHEKTVYEDILTWQVARLRRASGRHWFP
ncbi:hypothetical protein BDN72DRAFT_842015 [Pluteus cervinus]|uniref:Uncharacterized protein n=1 Tax=Pluteus cervinus TaxID=181527 RepID=A0ACD3AR77_9AGAR|nr:hypothetical protein BDN72DRAFT_842015 [Pluteus cervinus]